MKLERFYQSDLRNELEERFPGCVILKNDSAFMQGIPDLSVFWETHWAMLETKRAKNSARQANQDYYVDLFNRMSFGSFIDPTTSEGVLDALQRTWANQR